jgi:hypothetical protein
MSDGMNVDFGLLRKPPDFVGDYVNAFQVGRSLAQTQQPRAPADAPASAAVTVMAAPRPSSDAAAAVAAMGAPQRQAAAARAEALGALLTGLRGASADPAERLAIARHVAMRSPAMGIEPRAITADDVTDAGLDAHLAAIRSLYDALRGGAQPPRPPAASTDY